MLHFFSQNSNNTTIKPIYEEFPKKGRTFSEINDNEPIFYNDLFKINLATSITINEDFRKAQAFFIPDISWAYAYAKGIQNSKLFVINVEHDCLHYDDFINRGLLDFWNHCWNDMETNYVLVLDTLNLTQVECGLKPLLDVIGGLRPNLQGTTLGLPQNVKIFATVVSVKDTIGLPLTPRLFSKWGAIDFDLEPITFANNFWNKEHVIGYFEPKDLLFDSIEIDEEMKKNYYDY